MEKIGTRIAQIRGKDTRKNFANRIGIVENTLRNYELNLSLPNSDVIVAICREFDVSYTWLLTGKGGIAIEEELTPEGAASLLLKKVAWVAFAQKEGKIWPFDLELLENAGTIATMHLHIVSGDSMAPIINDGDTVLIDYANIELKAGKIFAFIFENNVYLKKVDMEPGKIILSCANSAYETIKIDTNSQEKETFQVLGRVLLSLRQYF